MNDKNHIIILIDTEKLLMKLNTIHDKNSPENGYGGKSPQHGKSHIWQTHSKHYSQWWKTKSISSNNRNKTRVSALITITQHSLGSPSHSNQRRKRNRRNPVWKRRVRTITEDDILYIENHNNSTRKVLELIDKYGKITYYKINTQKFLAFLYPHNERSEREIRNNFIY